MSRETKVPALPSPTATNLLEVAKAVKQVIDVREGLTGDPLDANVTYRDLIKSGAVIEAPGGPGSGGSVIAPPWVQPNGYDPVADLTTPPAPTSLTASGGFTNVYLQWDGAPIANLAYTEIWRSETNVLGNAVLVGTTASNVYADPAAAGVTYYYWIRFVSRANITGPYNSSTGTQATTVVDVSDAYDAIYSNTVASSDPNAGVPFIYLNSPLTIGGITYPAGTWIKSAFIANASIESAKIKDLVADKITTGSLTAAIGITTGYIYGGVAINHPFGSFNYGTGFFLGLDSSVYKFYVGSYSENMKWDGSNLSVTGNINATSGSFRNITIYDSSNNVILSSGGINTATLGLGSLAYQNSVSTGQVSGLGSLATQNSVNWNTQIINIPSFGNFAYLSTITSANISTYIQAAAIGTAYISNAAITSALIANAAVGSAQIADLAVTSAKIQDATISSAKIQDAAITNAKIGDLQVSTLKIGDNAVTVPVSAYTRAKLGYALSEFACQSLTVNATGAPALLIFAAQIYSATSENLFIRLDRIRGSTRTTIFQAGPGPAYDEKIIGENMATGTAIDQPAAGTVTYELIVGNTIGSYTSATSRAITYLEVKK